MARQTFFDVMRRAVARRLPALLPATMAGGALLLISAAWANAETLAASTSAGKVTLERVARLTHPWGMDFLPGGGLIVTERGGRLVLVEPGATGAAKIIEVAGAPEVYAYGQGGLLDVAVSPDFETSGVIYLSYAAAAAGGSQTVVQRAVLKRGPAPRLVEAKIIFRQEPAVRGGRHYGSRIVVAPDGNLFITLGDRGQRPMAQSKDAHMGKVVRITPTGAVPKDNPFLAAKDVLPEIWSLGHRNAQGAAIRPSDGALWTVEHGARGGDEINKPLPGRNYGWPVISYGTHYSGAKIGRGQKAPGFEQPAYYWDPSIAPSGLAFYSGDLFPSWKGSMLVGALKFRYLARLEMAGDKILREEKLFVGAIGRIRDVASGPKGAIWLLTDEGDGGLWRVTPAK
ncbi:MAG: PQQ-dependent sugar dehydrogenase [Neomegalonema sp.]|nr:PQQ-dependent sugar dehydrogenase [Neomegalonema sp.]